MAHRFIIGETPSSALGVLRGLWDRGAASSVDLLGEATVTQAEADRYAERCNDALEQLAGAARKWPERPMLEHDSVGRSRRPYGGPRSDDGLPDWPHRVRQELARHGARRVPVDDPGGRRRLPAQARHSLSRRPVFSWRQGARGCRE